MIKECPVCGKRIRWYSSTTYKDTDVKSQYDYHLKEYTPNPKEVTVCGNKCYETLEEKEIQKRKVLSEKIKPPQNKPLVNKSNKDRLVNLWIIIGRYILVSITTSAGGGIGMLVGHTEGLIIGSIIGLVVGIYACSEI